MNSLPFWKASSDLGKKVAPLLDLQFWLLGRDILHPAGNRLLAEGFERRRTSDERDHCSVYVKNPTTLWGFGLLWRPETSVLYVPRKPYAPRLLPPELDLSRVWSKRDLPPTPPPKTSEEAIALGLLLAEVFAWLADYEERAWAEDSGWRRACLTGWTEKNPAPETLAGNWRELSTQDFR